MGNIGDKVQLLGWLHLWSLDIEWVIIILNTSDAFGPRIIHWVESLQAHLLWWVAAHTTVFIFIALDFVGCGSFCFWSLSWVFARLYFQFGWAAFWIAWLRDGEAIENIFEFTESLQSLCFSLFAKFFLFFFCEFDGRRSGYLFGFPFDDDVF